MPLLLSPDALGVRRVAAAGPLAPLAASLRADLAPVLARAEADGVWLPPEKAELSRAGGVCPADGARLLFDPFAPRAHACPRCGRVYADEAHYRWWVMGYQLWLAERAVHAAALHALAPDDALGNFAGAVLAAHADAYRHYPNADNVLGPTRPFFSTYLESLWLLHVCVALDLLEGVGAASDALGAAVRGRVVEPSRALIAGFPEGRSNRQVWNAAARLAASRVLGDAAGARDAVHGPAGVVELLDAALLADGSWFEGENYHQFAHRGFWYALRTAEQAGVGIDPALVARFRAGYAAPFRVALPDETLPARRDSQYAVSLRQWRWAEWCELGLADGAPGPLGAWLARLYAPADSPVPHQTGRWRATGESERNEPASALSRADLGWKSLLFARPALPEHAADVAPGSDLLAEQGYAVLRRDGGRVYAALDYGGGGGGHGHPDRLNVILQDGPRRWLDDPGTGTYVERTLHWYRSTLAHSAPLVDGRSQDANESRLLGFDADDGAFAGVAARTAMSAATGHPRVVSASRVLVAGDAYVIDLFTWRGAAEPCTLDLPFHVEGRAAVGDISLQWTSFDPGGGGGLEDGFDFLRDAQVVALPGPDAVRLALHARADGATSTDAAAALWLLAPGATLWRAVAPGPPGTGERRFHAVRTRGRGGAVVAVWDLRGTLAGISRDNAGEIVVAHADGGTDRHSPPTQVQLDRRDLRDRLAPPPPGVNGRPEDAWRVERTGVTGPLGRQRLALVEPLRASAAHRPQHYFPFVPVQTLPADGSPLAFTLGEAHYLRSEPSWRDAGAPTATVRVGTADAGTALTIDVDVRLSRPASFAPPGVGNRLDNERADVNSDGLQLLIRAGRAAPVGWLLVPDFPPPAVRATRVTGDPDAPPLDARWEPRADGWRITCRVPLATVQAVRGAFGLDLAVNEKPPDRERRRGQLLLSEPLWPGEPSPGFVYLRGDRMDASRAVPFQLPPPAVP